jgi:methyl-accepting chemotaxis protein
MKLTFRRKLFLPLILSWLCLLTVISFNAIHDRKLRMDERKIQISNAVDMALSVAREYAGMADSGVLSTSEAQKQAMARIKALRYGDSGYFFLLNADQVLMNAAKPQMAGTRVDTFRDANGAFIFLDSLKVAKASGKGYTSYVWPKPGSASPEPKIAYNAHFEPWDWTIVTGLYVGDVDRAFYASVRDSILLLAAIGIVLTGVVLMNVRSIESSVGGEPEQAAKVACRIASGDLTVVVETRPDDTSSLMYAMKSMRDALAGIVGQVRTGTDAIAMASSQLAAGNLDLSARTEEQASSLEETASSMDAMTSTVKQSADNATQASLLAQAASEVARRGGEVVSKVVNTMVSIEASSNKIADIIGVIDGIAFQTNILALNAAVEAARAGEHGRGFAVVAAEVRNLAQRSAAAAKDIKELITSSVDEVESGAILVDQAGKTMREIVDSVRRVTDIIGDISVATQEQTVGIAQINQAIDEMDQVTQQNASLVEEAAAASEAMQEQADRLAKVVSVFRLHAPSAASVPARHGRIDSYPFKLA